MVSASPSAPNRSARPTGRTAPPTAKPSSSDPASSTVEVNRNLQLATAEAHRLHDLAARPPGAVPNDRPPATLAQSAMGTTDSGSLIDVVSFWTVPLSQHDSDAWIAAHVPVGLHGDFSSPGVGGPAPQDIVTGRGFAAPNGTAWMQATLQESVAVVDGHHSVWRVEGETIWLDPRPIRVRPTGPTLQVTVTGNCPATDRNITGVATGGAADTALLPAGDPTAALVCRYSGGNGTPFSLLQSSSLRSHASQQLADRVRAIPLAHDASDPARGCPMDDGAAAVIAFSFAGRPDVDLWVCTNGCPTVSNGRILAAGDPLS